MGACCTSLDDDQKRDQKIQKKINADQREQELVHKLLLLGAGESGKSTLFKQSISLYGRGITVQERMAYAPIIFGNTIRSMKTLIKESIKRASGDVKCTTPPYSELTPLKFAIASDLKEISDIVMSAKRGENGAYALTPKLASYINILWKDEGIRNTYQVRAEYQLNDNADYFFNQVEKLAVQGFVPSEDQMIRTRVRTTGASEIAIDIENVTIKMVDIGGQRSERKKWIRCFENVTCVCFVVAISTYNQVLFEDHETNRIVEALNVFEETCNTKWFDRSSIILFLNKRDLFVEKIKRFPITVCPALQDYEGPPDSFERSIEYIVNAFLDCNKTNKDIYPHATCATDKTNVNTVLIAVKDTILKENLREAGLMLGRG